MARIFGEMRARAFCHATESTERVREALMFVAGEGETREDRAEGHHGNPITVLSTVVDGTEGAERLLGMLDAESLREVASTLESRVDEACGLHLRFDKQEAYLGRLELSSGGDLVDVRIRILAFPARQELAVEVARRYLEDLSRSS